MKRTHHTGSKSDVCRFFLRGICRNGSRCKFQHIESPPIETLYLGNDFPEFIWNLGSHLPTLRDEMEMRKYLILDDDEKGL